MRRRWFPILPALSMLLCVAGCVLWVGSSTPWQWGCGSHPGVKWEVRSANGWLSVDRQEVLFWPNFNNGNLWAMRADERYSPGKENFTGLYWFRDEATFRRRLPGEERPPPAAVERKLPKQTWSYQSRLGVSYPLLCLVTSVPPLWLLGRRAWSRRKRLAAGLCPACGYDLRATPGRCPECGTGVLTAPPA